MREKVETYFGPQENYMQDFRKRIKWFLGIMAAFFIYMIVSVVWSFIDSTWDDSIVHVVFFIYLSLFTGFNWWRYHQNSVYEEKKHETIKDIKLEELLKSCGIEPFDHKKGRRSVAKMSCASIILNTVMITLHLTIDSF